MYPPRALEYYTAGLEQALLGDGSLSRSFKVVADLGLSPASFVLPSVAADWNIDLITLRGFVNSDRAGNGANERDAGLAEVARAVDAFQADLGISRDATAERITLVTGSGRILDSDTALHAMVSMWCRTEVVPGEGAGVAVPVTASRVIEEIARECGRSVVRTGTSRRALSSASLRPDVGFAGSRRGGFVFPRFLAAYDAVMSMGMLLRMLDQQNTTLDEVVAQLPAFHLRHQVVNCPFDRKGAVMRTMAAVGETGEAKMVEGVHITTSDGWALVLPHATEAIVHVYAEGSDGPSADVTLATYVAQVEAAIATG
jgi:mannose-1-phosphate guanylyltransferase/phosphomannomutase